MEKTMKVTIGGKTVNVSDPFRKEAIKDILIFGGFSGEREEKTVLSTIGNKKKISSRYKKVVRRERTYWTLEEEEKLKKLALRGMSVPELTRIFRKKYYNISNKLRGLNIQEEYKKAREYKRDEETRIANSKKDSEITEGEAGNESEQNSPWN